MSRSVAQPLRLSAAADAEVHRKVTWLELFFDLVFVAAVAQVAEPLRHHYSAAGVLTFAVLFALIWWAWCGYTFFASRFDADDRLQRILMLLQMFVVSAMAANAGEQLDSRSSAGFAAAYAVLRVLLVLQYLRARHVAGARPLILRYVVGYGTAATLWLASAAIPAPERYFVWAVALVIDLGTPLAGLMHAAKAPTHSAHLPERFGLFTLILLGEAVVAVMHGMKSHDDWRPEAAAAAFLGVALVFILWWWYFHGAGAAGERAIRSHADMLRAQLWTYAHFPFYVGLVILGVGIQRAVEAASRRNLEPAEIAMLAGATAVVYMALASLRTLSRGRQSRLAAVVLAGSLFVLAVSPLAGAVTPLAAVASVACLTTALAADFGLGRSTRRGSAPALVGRPAAG